MCRVRTFPVRIVKGLWFVSLFGGLVLCFGVCCRLHSFLFGCTAVPIPQLRQELFGSLLGSERSLRCEAFQFRSFSPHAVLSSEISPFRAPR